LGGVLGLLQYLDYHPTHDVDVWWSATATEKERRQVIKIVEEVLQSFGEVDIRIWGDVVSIELRRGTGAVFSFQIASRSVKLSPPTQSPLDCNAIR
jgi:hypothetical protein